MRNISFDESTVLSEFAQIMKDQDLVKEAAGETRMPISGVGTSIPAPEIQTSNVMPAPDLGEKKEVALPNEKPEIPSVKPVAMVDQRIVPALKTQILSGLKAISVDPNQINREMLKVNQLLEKYIAQKMIDKGSADSILKDFEQKAQQFVKPASIQDETVKQAAGEKLYDISGETGEDLVDQAHPGGGTETEVTNSKTKENLVETIIEQQERDIAVVNKMPKGTYAAVVQTLVSLADKLDAQGLRKEADAIDKILELYKPAQKKNEDGIVKEAEPPAWYDKPGAQSTPAANSTPAQTKAPEIYEGLYPQSRLDKPSAGMTGQEKLEPIPVTDKKTEKFQNWYNESLAKIRQKLTKEQAKTFSDMLLGLKIDVLVPDNKWGPRTKAAWELVKRNGGMKGFINTLSGKLTAQSPAQFKDMKLTAPSGYLGGKTPKTVSTTPISPPAMSPAQMSIKEMSGRWTPTSKK